FDADRDEIRRGVFAIERVCKVAEIVTEGRAQTIRERLGPKKRCGLALVADVRRAVALVHETEFDERLAAQLDLGRNRRTLRTGRDGRAERIQETLIGARVTRTHDRFAPAERLRQLKPVSVAVVRV